MLQTPHVFLDAEVIVGKNFSYRNADLVSLGDHARAGTISLYITDVTNHEIRQKIADRVSAAKQAFEPLRSFKTRPNVLILRNVADLGFSGVFQFDELAVRQALIAQYEQYLRDSKVTIIPAGEISASSILEKYFAGTPPFEKREEKKHEFPDAFTVAIISAWCAKEGVSAYVISEDKGVKSACANEPGVLPLSTIPELTGLIALAAPRQADLARNWVGFCDNYIRTQIASAFERMGFFLEDQEGEVLSVTVDPALISLDTPEFLDVSEGAATVVLRAEIPYAAEVHYEDPDATVWDEGDKFVFDYIDKTVQCDETMDIYIDLKFNPALEVPPLETASGEDDHDVVERITLEYADIGVVADPWEGYH